MKNASAGTIVLIVLISLVLIIVLLVRNWRDRKKELPPENTDDTVGQGRGDYRRRRNRI
ncbi:MAG: hypothetical protein QM781_07375 [Chitinophagaceae bacterium]